MANDKVRAKTLQSQDLVPAPSFPDNPPVDLLSDLTGEELAFVRAYVQSGDARQAFRAAGKEHGQRYPGPLSYEYLRRPKIRRAVDRLQDFYARHTGLYAGQLMQLLKSHATHDPVALYEDNGTSWGLKPLAEWPLESRQSIHKLRVQEWVTEEGTKRQIEVEFCDRQRAISLLGKHLKLFDKTQQTAPFTLILNANPEATELKQVGQTTINGIGLEIRVPDADER